MLHATDEAQLRVAHQDAGQKPEFDQNLEAVADAEDEPAALGMGAHRRHDRRMGGDRAAAQIIAVGEAARQHDEIGPRRQFGLGMPDDLRRAMDVSVREKRRLRGWSRERE